MRTRYVLIGFIPLMVFLIGQPVHWSPVNAQPAEKPSLDKATQVWTIPWDADWVTAVTFMGESRRLAAGNKLGQILIFDIPDKTGGPFPPPQHRLDGHTNMITALAVTPDGRWLFSASYDHTIRVWDLQAPAKSNGTATLKG